MKKDITYVAMDDSKRRIVAGILRPGETEPELPLCDTRISDPRDSRS